ncbi:MAG: carboxypeptidase regulatory-like domain-containing protein [Bacteroidales bacterium]|nr:carboxypeptidase regulatory-like domain-containing protein [Bacteroidales bacterium]
MKRLMTTLLFVLLCGTGLCLADGVTVSGAVTCDNPYNPQYPVENGISGTVRLLNQDGSVAYSGTVADNDSYKSVYTITDVAAGSYVLDFEGGVYDKILVFNGNITVETSNLEHDFKATVDDTRGYLQIAVKYGEWNAQYQYWANSKNIANATVACTPTSGSDAKTLTAISDSYGNVKFLVKKDADLRYAINIRAESYLDKDTVLTAYGEKYGSMAFLSHEIYMAEKPLPPAAISGEVTLHGESLATLPGGDMKIGLKTVRGKHLSATVLNGRYNFTDIPVGETMFYVYDPQGGYDYDLGTTKATNYAIKSPADGKFTLTEDGLTLNIELERIAVNVSGKVDGLSDAVSLYLMNGETRAYEVRSNLIGEYTFQGVKPGTYTVVASAFGYEQQNTPSVTVTLEADVTADKIVMEGKEMEFTFVNTYFGASNPYTGEYALLAGAVIELWNADGTTKITETTAGDAQAYAAWSLKTTGRMGAKYLIRIKHTDIEDFEMSVTAAQEKTSVYPSGIQFRYDGPALLPVESFLAQWNETQDTLLLSWRWPEALRDQENYKVEMVRLSRKLSSESGMGTALTYWSAPYDQTTYESVFAFDALPVAFKDSTAVNGNSYTYRFEIRYKKPYSAVFDTTFEVDLRILSRLTYEVNDPVMGRIVNKTTIEASDGNLYRQGDQIHLLAVANDGFRFVHWLDNGAVVEQETQKTDSSLISFQMPDKDVTYKAVFRKSRFVITLNATPENAGTVSGAGTYEGDASVTVKAVAHNGYQFKAWMEGDEEVSTKAEYTFQPEDDRSLTAVFIETQYVLGLGVNNPAWGTVEGSGEFAGGTEVTVKATPNEGYKFIAWQEDGAEVSKEAVYTFKIEKDITLTAVFADAAQKYTVTLNANHDEWGKTERAGEFAEGSTVTIKATPNENYHFVAWMEGETEVSTTAVYTFKVEKDVTLTAVFAEGSANEQCEAARWSVYAENGTLVIIGLNGDRYSVYDLNGRLSGQARCTGAEIRMDVTPNRLYIVRRVTAAGAFDAKKMVVR